MGAERTAQLLKAYWTIPERQIETSVVLAWSPPAAADGGSSDGRRGHHANVATIQLLIERVDPKGAGRDHRQRWL